MRGLPAVAVSGVVVVVVVVDVVVVVVIVVGGGGGGVFGVTVVCSATYTIICTGKPRLHMQLLVSSHSDLSSDVYIPNAPVLLPVFRQIRNPQVNSPITLVSGMGVSFCFVS